MVLAPRALAGAPGQATPPEWMRTARVFLLDAYQYPFAPNLEFDAEKTAQVMAGMRFNTIRFPAIGMYATIQGVRFPVFPGQGSRDLLAEMIAAAKPRGIRVVVYIGTGHKLAWSIVTRHHPEYAQQTRPGGPPDRNHFFVGEDFGTICWNTPYREAYLDMLTRLARDYDIDGVYFDRWTPNYFWPGLRVCYCDGCRRGFRAVGGEELPYRENRADYTEAELATIRRYHAWYRDVLVGILNEARKIVKSHKKIPLIANINNPRLMATEDPRLLAPMDAFLYERSASLLERAEGVSLARAAGFGIWPYVGSYHNWPRLAEAGYDYTQEILTTAAFGGAPIIAQPTGYLLHAENRRFVSQPFSLLAEHESDHSGFENVPYIAVVWADHNPPGHARSGWWWKADARSSTLGAFAACLYRHVQVSSVADRILDDPSALARYRVLYLADIVHLTRQRVANIKKFVRNGGGLVAGWATSVFSAAGVRQDRFSLEELIRVRPAGTEGQVGELMYVYSTILGGPNELYLRARPGSGVLSPSWDNRLVPLWFYEPVEALDGARVVMDIVTGDGGRPVLPGVIVSEYGKGRVLYCASAIESLFAGNNEKVLGDLIRDLALSVSPVPPPYELDASSALVANLTAKGNRRVLHLLNWTSNHSERGHASRYYLPPVENVKVRLRGAAAGLASYPAKGLKQHRRGTALEITIPRIAEYQAISWAE